MRSMFFGAVLLSLATPAIAQKQTAAVAVATAAAPTKDKDSARKKTDEFDVAQMMAVFDKIFPAQPDPLPARLALSRTTVQGLFPDGSYARLMNDVMGGMVDRVMGLTGADFRKPGDKPGSADATTLRQKVMKEDPYFEERMRITQRVLMDEMAKIATIIEPRLREGLARSMARRFDEKQLTDINAFLATDSGRAYGRQSMAMWVDPDVMRSMFTSFPEIMKAMPAAMQRVESETAHLPKPKKPQKAKSKS